MCPRPTPACGCPPWPHNWAVPSRCSPAAGLRTGADVLTALGLGARAVFLVRPVLWALTCGGADGVAGLLTGLTSDLAHAMALAGVASVADLPGVTWRRPA